MLSDHEKLHSSMDEESIERADRSHLPLMSRDINRLKTAPYSADEAQLMASSNDVSLMQKKRKYAESFKDDKIYYFKRHKAGSRLSELEAYCAEICKYLATSEYVPSLHSYYDNSHQLIGTAAKKINFIPNCEDPLRREDTLIDSLVIKIEQKKRIMMRAIVGLIASLEKSKSQNVVQAMQHSFFNPQITSYRMNKFLQSYQRSPEKFSTKSLDLLSTMIKKRKKSIRENSHISNYPADEMPLLEEIRQTILAIKKLMTMEKQPGHDIEMLEEIDRKLKQDHVDVDKSDQYVYVNFADTELKVSMTDMLNYRILKGLAVSLSTRYIFKEGDNNSSNMSKRGQIVDFDWTKANILFEFKEHDIFNGIIRRPQKDSFACTQHNIQYFPDVMSTHLYYWPTKQPEVYKIIIEVVSQFLNRCGNLYVEDDKDIYRRVANAVLLVSDQFSRDDDAIKSYHDQIINFAYNIVIKVKSLLSGRPEQKIIEEEKIKYIFNMLNQQLLALTIEHKDAIATVEDVGQSLLGNPRNAFTKNDNEVYKSLSTHPVFIFHKYKTFLKYILTGWQLYESIAQVHISDQPFPKSPHEDVYLRDDVINDEFARIDEVRNALLDMDDFKDFLIEHGEYAFNLIKEECLTYRESYASKSETKPYLQSLVQSVDMDAMEERFQVLCVELGIEKKTNSYALSI